jgi:hypothetical protein
MFKLPAYDPFFWVESAGRRSAANLMTKDEAPALRGEHRQAAGAVAEKVARVSPPPRCPVWIVVREPERARNAQAGTWQKGAAG